MTQGSCETEAMHLLPPGGHPSCLAPERKSSSHDQSDAQPEGSEAEGQGVVVTNNVSTRHSAWAHCPGPRQLHLPLGLVQ